MMTAKDNNVESVMVYSKKREELKVKRKCLKFACQSSAASTQCVDLYTKIDSIYHHIAYRTKSITISFEMRRDIISF